MYYGASYTFDTSVFLVSIFFELTFWFLTIQFGSNTRGSLSQIADFLPSTSKVRNTTSFQWSIKHLDWQCCILCFRNLSSRSFPKLYSRIMLSKKSFFRIILFVSRLILVWWWIGRACSLRNVWFVSQIWLNSPYTYCFENTATLYSGLWNPNSWPMKQCWTLRKRY